MVTPNWYIFGLLLPALVAMGLARLLPRIVGDLLGIAAAFAIGFFAVFDKPGGEFPTAYEAHDWLLVALLPAGVLIGILEGITKVPRWHVWLLRLVAACTFGPLLLQSTLRYAGEPWAEWSTGQAGVWVSVIAVISISWWVGLRGLAMCWAERLSGVLIAATTLAVGIVAIAGGYQTLGQIAITLGVATATLALFSGTGWLDVVILMSLGLMVSAWHFGSTVTGPIVALLLLAPLLAWVFSIPKLKMIPGKTWLCIGLVLLCLTTAIALAGYERIVDHSQEPQTPASSWP